MSNRLSRYCNLNKPSTEANTFVNTWRSSGLKLKVLILY